MSLFSWNDQRKQIAALRLDVDKVKADVQRLDEEWSDYYDRFRRMLAKMAKRDERAEQARESEDTQPAEQGFDMRLTPKQRLIQSQILARRQRPNGGGE